jgi:cation transport protein ChaC
MSMALTADLVARVERLEPDPGNIFGSADLSEASCRDWCQRLLAERPADRALWIFAYGSLIWNPVFAAAEEVPAVAHGWHRAFSLRLMRWRGTPERPGLMLALDRGGSCRGVAYRVVEQNCEEALRALLMREMSEDPCANQPRWIAVRTASGERLTALAFVVDRRAADYAGRLDENTVATTLATAAGHWGSCADYLYRTVQHLEGRGIRDRRLWRLQARVAEIIRALPAGWSALGAGAGM